MYKSTINAGGDALQSKEFVVKLFLNFFQNILAL